MRHINRRTFLGFTLVSPWAVATAVANQPEDLTAMLQTIRESSGVPALAAGVMKGGKVLAAGAVGVRKVGAAIPITIADKFHIGSDTKAMTATVAAMLVESGKLQWHQTLADLFPERAAKMDAGYRKVTLEMLLTHQAGMPPNSHSYGGENDPVTVQRLTYLDGIINQPPATKPGSQFVYSNAGYIIAGAILERITGTAWETLMQERLFRPLGMSSAGFGPPARPNQVDQPWGHVFKDDKFAPRYGDNPPALGPAGTGHCAILDYLKFADLHASSGRRPSGLLSPAQCEVLHTPAPGRSYAFGWETAPRSWAQGRALTHAGSNTMNYFVVWIAPKIEFAIAVGVNAAGGKVPEVADQVAAKLVRQFAG